MTAPDVLVNNMTRPETLKDIKNFVLSLPDETLEQVVVFNIKWGNEAGTVSWKRKETPKQYWRRKQQTVAADELISTCEPIGKTHDILSTN